jgi:hypothetical protein
MGVRGPCVLVPSINGRNATRRPTRAQIDRHQQADEISGLGFVRKRAGMLLERQRLGGLALVSPKLQMPRLRAKEGGAPAAWLAQAEASNQDGVSL